MKNFLIIAGISAVCLVVAGGKLYYDTESNLAGVCGEVGRPLTFAEKKQRITEQLKISTGHLELFDSPIIKQRWKNDNIDPTEKYGRWTLGRQKYVDDYRITHHDLHFFTKMPKHRSAYYLNEVSPEEIVEGGDTDLRIYIYPDLPKKSFGRFFCKPKMRHDLYEGEFACGKYNETKSVPKKYKSQGYAYDLVFLEFNTIYNLQPEGRMIFPTTRNFWTNSCAHYVKYPEEFVRYH